MIITIDYRGGPRTIVYSHGHTCGYTTGHHYGHGHYQVTNSKEAISQSLQTKLNDPVTKVDL